MRYADIVYIAHGDIVIMYKMKIHKSGIVEK